MILVSFSFHGNDNNFLQIFGCASQAWWYTKTMSRPYFLSAYKINSRSKCENHDSVEQLLEGACFIYKVIQGLWIFVILLLMVYILWKGSCIENRYILCNLWYKLSSIRSGSRIKRMRVLYTLSFWEWWTSNCYHCFCADSGKFYFSKWHSN